jgi:hypothetical protein
MEPARAVGSGTALSQAFRTSEELANSTFGLYIDIRRLEKSGIKPLGWRSGLPGNATNQCRGPSKFFGILGGVLLGISPYDRWTGYNTVAPLKD